MPTNYAPPSHADSAHVDAHKHCFKNRAVIESSELCGCFYCLAIFPAAEITEWWDLPEGMLPDENMSHSMYNALALTATCPRCGIDSVIGDASEFPVTTEFLQKMQRRWFW